MDDSLVQLVAAQMHARRVVLAVSGGRDSMALLHAAAAGARDSIAAVASFDHATGAPLRARAGARNPDGWCARARNDLRARVHCGAHGGRVAGAALELPSRASRATRGAHIATAHTRDDQIETVLMRAMRGAGARGLAALEAESPSSSGASQAVLRPLLSRSRADVAAYAARMGDRVARRSVERARQIISAIGFDTICFQRSRARDHRLQARASRRSAHAPPRCAPTSSVSSTGRSIPSVATGQFWLLAR